jgi:ABC-type spermidine/putrescine transport system permease subunit II
MLVLALSFEEVIATTSTAEQQSTLPICMQCELVRPR